jgi:hypothetical protein
MLKPPYQSVLQRRRLLGRKQRQHERRNYEQTNNDAGLSDDFFQMRIRLITLATSSYAASLCNADQHAERRKKENSLIP